MKEDNEWCPEPTRLERSFVPMVLLWIGISAVLICASGLIMFATVQMFLHVIGVIF